MIEPKDLSQITLEPMFVDACIMGWPKSNERNAKVKLNYRSLIKNPAGEKLESGYFAGVGSMEPGIHLHWILPDQYTHGIQKEEQGEMIYPVVPNRWMITRLSYVDDEKMQMKKKTWIVESDVIRKTGSIYESSMIEVTDTAQPYRYLGCEYEYEGKTTSDIEHYPGMTAVSSGLPYFNAYYPECQHVFGFCDTCEDLAEATVMSPVKLMYVVCGWWEKNQETSLHVMLHGCVTDLQWTGNETEYESGVPRIDTLSNIALANSSEEALAAMLAYKQNDPSLEILLQSLLQGTLNDWSELDGKLNAEAKIHQHTFAIEAGAEEWVIQKDKEMYDIDTEQRCKQLNMVSKQAFLLRQEIKELQQAVYYLWYDIKTGKTNRTEGISNIMHLASSLQEKYKTEENLKGKQKHLQEQIEGSLKQDQQLTKIPGQRYYLPKEPVLLIEGSDQKSIYRKIEAYKELDVVNRKGSEAVSHIKLYTQDFPSGIFELDSHLYQNIFKTVDTVELPEIVQVLISEALMLCKMGIYYLIKKEAQKYGLHYKYERIANILSIYQKELEKNAIAEGIRPNPLCINSWTPPWNPLFMEWQVRFHPDPQYQSDEYQASNWNFDGKDYIPKNDFNMKDPFVYTGRTILSSHESDVLAERFDQFTESAYPEVKMKIKQMRILSQSLGGLYDFMLKEDRSLLVMPWQKGDSKLDDLVTALLGEEDLAQRYKKEIPLFPVRAGKLELCNLRIIDCFGRAIDYTIGDVILPISFQDRNHSQINNAFLKPRILQPLRIQFTWDEMQCGQDEKSCIFGWIWANMNESCIHVYRSNGQMLGSIQLIYRGNNQTEMKAVFANPPGETREFEELLEDANVHLRQFILDLLAACNENIYVLNHVLEVINDSMWNIHSSGMQRNSDIFAYLGHPLALCGITLSYELLGSFRYNEENGRRFSSIQHSIFPICLGDVEKQGDGVIGYYLHEDGLLNYQQLHLSHAFDKDSNRKFKEKDGYISNQNQIPLSMDRNSQPVHVSILMSPYGKLTINSGILPVKEEQLPVSLTDEALRHIYLSLFYGPYLTSEKEIQLIQPKALEKQWYYMDYEAPGKKCITKELHTPQLHAVSNEDIVIKEGWLLLREQDRVNEEKKQDE